ncbi:1596_t:CDS:2 [Entrophospora sp. SA101]|nr:1596_t:CDS:2 [Entrophospora sp. SA101]
MDWGPIEENVSKNDKRKQSSKNSPSLHLYKCIAFKNSVQECVTLSFSI